MAVRIKLQRMGAKQHPFYRLVVGEARAARGGKVLENLGTYDPRGDEPALRVNAERALHWLQRGAQPTEGVRELLRKAGVMRQFAEMRSGGSAR
jgi:small subunit ribosomal protein S16